MQPLKRLFQRRSLFSGILLLLVLLFITSQSPYAAQARASAQPTAPLASEPDRESEDPFNQINAALLSEGKLVEFSTGAIPQAAFSSQPFGKKPAENPGPGRPLEKIHPVLKKWGAVRGKDERERLVITLRDDVRIPRFPEPEVSEGRDTAVNIAVFARAEELVQEIKGQRAKGYAKLADELAQRHTARVLETFWLINGMVVDMPLGAVSALAAREDVLYIEPQSAGEAPPAGEVADGRALIASDPYFNLGLSNGWIGLLDTGVRPTHTLLNNPSHIYYQRDCVNGGAYCTSGSAPNPIDDCWNHGTASAAIITANSNQGNLYRGVTGIGLDSFKVYPTSFDPLTGQCNGFLDTTAAVNGFQAAVAALDRVIVAEMQGSGNEISAISVAADKAFDAGAVVIAANGNFGPGFGTVNAPANAHKVLGVGAFDVVTLSQYSGQSRGPTSDNRTKPDIQAPTSAYTASNASDTALNYFTGTSGATPFAAGAAALLRNWLIGSRFSIDPGQVYAQMILSGQHDSFNNTTGAGPLKLPNSGYAWWGKISVSNGQTIDIPLNISGAAANTFDGALWWPETAAQAHNDIDLTLIDPSGVQRDLSWSIPSVFERARVAGSVPSGTWKLRIRGYNVPTGSQTVYWAAHVRLY
jgi:serine protease AprX